MKTPQTKGKTEDKEVNKEEVFPAKDFSQQERVALFVISLLNFSVELEEVTSGQKYVEEGLDLAAPCTDVDPRCSWNEVVMRLLAAELHIPSEFSELYDHLLPSEFHVKNEELEEEYLNLLSSPPAPSDSSVSHCSIFTLSKLAIVLIVHGSYNARGRAYVQNLCAAMKISNMEYIDMERKISQSLSHIQLSLSRLQREEEKQGKKGHDLKRYAKIGAVSVGAGALLAFTGGLAAPAVAAALLVFGTSTAVAAAAFTSATVMSGLFGSAGMGLAGYKMARRTKGISEFVFESEENFGSLALLDEKSEDDIDSQQHGEQHSKTNKWSPFGKKTNKESTVEEENTCRINPLSVMICVSGWMFDKEDYKKSFGIVPHVMEDDERVRRFYLMHCPQRADRASEDVQAWKNSGSTAGATLKDKRGQVEGSSFSSFKESVSSNFESLSSAAGYGNEMDEFYDNLTDIYGADPRLVESLMPPRLFPHKTVDELKEGGEVEADGDLMKSILKTITNVMESKQQADELQGKKLKKNDVLPPPPVKLRTRTPTSWPPKPRYKRSSSSELRVQGLKEDDIESSDDEDEHKCDPSAESVVTSDDTLGMDIIKVEDEVDSDVQHDDNETEVNSDAATEAVSADDTLKRLETEFWHWNQTTLSGAYEINLLRWETSMQLELGKSIQQMLKDLSEAVATKVLQATVLAALMTAVIVPYSLLRFMDKIDNIWDIATERAETAGKMLAHVLLKRPQGSRSVTLVGHSIGARLIFSCLQELYRCKQLYLEERLATLRTNAEESALREGRVFEKKKEKRSMASSMVSGMKTMWKEDSDKSDNDAKELSPESSSRVEPFPLDAVDLKLAKRLADVEDFTLYDFKHADNIVQDVVLLGTPASTNRTAWKKARAVVSGRFINGYSENDIILALVYRYNKLAIKVAGLREIHVDGIENIDFSAIVKKHTDYCLNMQDILNSIDLLGAADPANVYKHQDSKTDDGADESSSGHDVSKSSAVL